MVHWVKFSLGNSHLRPLSEDGSGYIPDDSTDNFHDGSINDTCVQNHKLEFDENLLKYSDLLSISIHKDITLYEDDLHEVQFYFGNHIYMTSDEEGATEVISVLENHGKHVTAMWNDIEAKIETSMDGRTSLYIQTSNTTLNCTYLVDTSKHHGNIILHPVFFTLAFSHDGEKLMYLAEALPNPAIDWIRFSPNLGGNWKYKVKKPLLFVLDIKTRTIMQHHVTAGHVAGKSLWIPYSKNVITVTRPMRYTPCPECTDHPTRLVQIDTDTGAFDILSEANDHVSFPACTPDGGSILFFKNKLHINHHEKMVPSSNNAPQSLVMVSLEDKNITVLVDEDFGLNGEQGLYPHVVNPWAKRMFLEDEHRFIISCFISNNMYVIDIESEEVLLVEERTGIVLDVLQDKILSLHNSPEHGQELRLGTLVDVEMTTLIPIPTTTRATTKPSEETTTIGHTADETTVKETTTEVEPGHDYTTPKTSLPLKKNETDPCQELIDSLLAELNKEDLERYSEPAKLVMTPVSDTTTEVATTVNTVFETSLKVITSEVKDSTDAIKMPTTTFIQDTTVEPSIDLIIKPLKGIKMETTNVLTFSPMDSIHTNMKIHEVEKDKASFQTVHAKSQTSKSSTSNLLVFIGGMDGKTMPIHSMYMWIAAGWSVLQVNYRGTPTMFRNEDSIIGENLEKEVEDCHHVVICETRDWDYDNILLLGHGMGATVASNLAARHPGTYGHMVLVNPILSLPMLIVERPNYIRRIFNPKSFWFTPVDVASSWKASPLSQISQIKTTVLLITTWDVLKMQAQLFDRKLRDNGVSSEYYQLEQSAENKISTIEMMVRWAEKHYQDYDNQCFVPAVITTTPTPTETETLEAESSSSSSTKEIKNPIDDEINTKPVSSSSMTMLSSLTVLIWCFSLVQ